MRPLFLHSLKARVRWPQGLRWPNRLRTNFRLLERVYPAPQRYATAGFGRLLWPAVNILGLVLVAALPWGLPSELRFFLPMLPFAAIHQWASTDRTRCPAGLVFGAGLSLDVLTNGPLGYWSLIYLAGYAMSVFASHFNSRGVITRIAVFAVILVILAAAAWSVASVYQFEIADWRPFAWGMVLSFAASMIWLAILRMVHGPKRLRNARFERGG